MLVGGTYSCSALALADGFVVPHPVANTAIIATPIAQDIALIPNLTLFDNMITSASIPLATMKSVADNPHSVQKQNKFIRINKSNDLRKMCQWKNRKMKGETMVGDTGIEPVASSV